MSRNRVLRKAIARSLKAMRSSPMVAIPNKSGLSKTELLGITAPPVAGATGMPMIASGWHNDNRNMAAATRVEKDQVNLWLDLEAQKQGFDDFAEMNGRASEADIAAVRRNATKRSSARGRK